MGEPLNHTSPSVGAELTGEALQESGLAAAAWAGHGEDLALADAEGDSGEGGGAAVAVVQAAGPENVVVRRGHHLRTSCLFASTRSPVRVNDHGGYRSLAR